MNLSVRNQLTIGAGLVLLMILTREYHFSSLHSLPGASWAIFFLAGLYLRAISVSYTHLTLPTSDLL